MNSLTAKPSIFLPKLSSSSVSNGPRFPSSLVSFRWRSKSVAGCGRGRLVVRVQASGAAKPDGSNDTNGALRNRREILMEYVKTVQPEFMELFSKRAPPLVVDAMRQTVSNMIGTLPPQFFAVTVSTVAESLAQLMYSVLMTGYMFQNAQYRLELQESLEHVALPDVKEKELDNTDYATLTQKNVSGEVIRWNNVSGPETIDAKKYIEILEAELEELNRQVGRKSTHGGNELLDYCRNLEPQNIKELSNSAGEDAVVAMNAFIKRLLVVTDKEKMKTSTTETSAAELGKLLYWLMVVGYSIRNIEVRFDMERVLGSSPKMPELPSGEA
ncbi:unnamed protein product [Linum tenue]|uniref:Uncharacterized protein n=1 Tax=Linum tenue TaxID=586396 RepID=A0AAV0LN12_9ROSI|nr:unnamed protein product [Linum tenue]